MTVYTIKSEYSLGTRVVFNSKYNGSGEGVIIGIAFHEDSSIYYFILQPSGEAVGGILPQDITESDSKHVLQKAGEVTKYNLPDPISEV